jgi:hypothetical protein
MDITVATVTAPATTSIDITPFPVNSLQKRKRKWQLRREIRRISALNFVESPAVLDFAIYTRESNGNLQWKRYRWEVVEIKTFNALQCARISWN